MITPRSCSPFLKTVSSAFAALALTTAATLAQAVTPGSMAGGYSSSPINPYFVFANNENYTNTNVTSISFSNSLTSLSANAGFGAVSLIHNYRTTGGGLIQKLDAEIAGGFQDVLTINGGAGLNGTAGTFTGSIRITLDHEASFSTNRDLFQVGVGSSMGGAQGAIDGFPGYASFLNGGLAPQDYNNYSLEFSVPFTFGTPFSLGVWARSRISTDNSTTIVKSMSHNGLVGWGGPVSVQGNGGNNVPLSSLTMSSGSGFNYAQAVPEPSTGLMVLGAAVAMQFIRRRRTTV